MLWNYSIHALTWDLAIAALIAGGIAVEYYAWCFWRAHPSHPGRWFVLLLLLLAQVEWLTVFYGSFIEPQIITVTEKGITLPIAGEMTIVALSDLHVGPYKGRKFLERAVAK